MKRALVIGVLLLDAVLSHRRVAVFADNASLWSEAVRVAPCSARAHYNLSEAVKRSDPSRALTELQTTAVLATQMDPRCVSR